MNQKIYWVWFLFSFFPIIYMSIWYGLNSVRYPNLIKMSSISLFCHCTYNNNDKTYALICATESTVSLNIEQMKYITF